MSMKRSRSVKGTNSWITLKEWMDEGIKKQWRLFKCNLICNFMITATYFMLMFMFMSSIEKIILEDENWLNKTLVFSVLAAIPWLFGKTIVVKFIWVIEFGFLLIELSLIFMLGVILNYNIDNNLELLIMFNEFLITSFVNNALAMEPMETHQKN